MRLCCPCSKHLKSLQDVGSDKFALHVLVARKNFHKLKELLTASPERTVCVSGDYKIVKYLLSEFKYDLNAKDNDSHTPVHLVCHEGYPDILRLLFDQGNIDVCAQDSKGHSPLHYACQNGHLDVVEILVEEKKCPIMIEDDNKITPLELAGETGNLQILKFLVKNGAELHHSDVHNRTVLHYACQRDYIDVVEYLITDNDMSCLSTKKESGFVTPLHIAAEGGSL